MNFVPNFGTFFCRFKNLSYICIANTYGGCEVAPVGAFFVPVIFSGISPRAIIVIVIAPTLKSVLAAG